MSLQGNNEKTSMAPVIRETIPAYEPFDSNGRPPSFEAVYRQKFTETETLPIPNLTPLTAHVIAFINPWTDYSIISLCFTDFVPSMKRSSERR